MSDQFNAILLQPREECVKQIVALLPSKPLIVEAGAFNGSDTRCFVKQWPNSIIHAFEPVPSIFEQLVENTRPFPNVTCHQLALGNSNGTATLHIAEKYSKPGIPSQASSLLVPHAPATHSRIHFPTSIEVSTITLDTWAEKNFSFNKTNFPPSVHPACPSKLPERSRKHRSSECTARAENTSKGINLLWLDLQGLELAVLRAAPIMIKKIDVIVLEAATIKRYEAQPLVDEIIAWLHANGFEAVVRDFDGIDLKFGNVVFRKKTSI